MGTPLPTPSATPRIEWAEMLNEAILSREADAQAADAALDAATEKKPQMDSWPIYLYGNSYSVLTGGVNFTDGNHYAQQVAAALGAGAVTSYGVSGARAIDTWAHAVSQAAWPGGGNNPVTGAQWPGVSARNGLLVLELPVNDISHAASGAAPAAITTANTQYLDSMKAVRRAILALLSSESRVETGAYSATSGVWGSLAGNYLSADSLQYTTAAGAYREYSITPAQSGPLAGKVYLVVLTQRTADGTLAPITVAVDGVSQGTTTLSPWEGYTGAAGAVNTGVSCIPITVPVDNAAHTIRITHAGSEGQPLYADVFLIPSEDPNPIMVMGGETMPAVGFYNAAQVGIYKGNAALLNPVIKAVVAEFANAVYVPSTMTVGGLWSGDKIHPNDRGMTQRANDLQTAITTAIRAQLESRRLANLADASFGII